MREAVRRRKMRSWRLLRQLLQPQHRCPTELLTPHSTFQRKDKILLDPSCSAMGQRPLLRWGISAEEAADLGGFLTL